MDVSASIIGAGVVGLAIGAWLSECMDGVFILEKNDRFGQETSSRNSEVIHSGIYYPTGSLKASLCVEGNRMLYEYCALHDVPHRKLGKLVVATSPDEVARLDAILRQSQVNGVSDGYLMTAAEVAEMEPQVNALAAIYFPSTGIIDSMGLMQSLARDCAVHQATMVYRSEVTDIRKIEGGYEVQVKEPDGRYSFSTKYLINAAGLNSDKIARLSGTFIESDQLFFWKGEYFAVRNAKRKSINHLVYPVPQANHVSLGVHATIGLDHSLKLGPDATFLPDGGIEYSVHSSKRQAFYEGASRFLPFLEADDLSPDQAGIRPKLIKPGGKERDFVIREETMAGMPGLVNLIGIESPGLTSCLAIAKHIDNLLTKEKTVHR